MEEAKIDARNDKIADYGCQDICDWQLCGYSSSGRKAEKALEYCEKGSSPFVSEKRWRGVFAEVTKIRGF